MPNLVVAVVLDIDTCHNVVRLWESLGVGGATILDSIGMRRLLAQSNRDDLPLMPSLSALLQGEEYNHRTILTVVPDDLDLDDLIRKTEALVGNFDDDETGFLFVVPVLMARGLGRGGAGAGRGAS